jgi:two-component system chemotaxis response regulator CheB
LAVLQGTVRVLICDDSAVARQFIARACEGVPGIEIAGRAGTGEEAVRLARLIRPDVITMDVEMPGMGGIEAVRRIMEVVPTPILMVSSLTHEGSRVTLEALTAGALDFVPKPSGSEDAHRQAALVAEKILQLGERGRQALGLGRPQPTQGVAETAAARPEPPRPPVQVPLPPPRSGRLPLVVIGASTGGPRALFSVVPHLPATFGAAVLIVQHMPQGFTRSLAERLDQQGPLPVREAQEADELQAGVVRVAPAGHHLVVAGRFLRLEDTPSEHGVRPAIDVTLRTAAASFPGPIVAAVLTGMGRDGTEGALKVRQAGGRVIAESEATALIYGMPKSVVEAGAADRIATLPEVAEEIVRLVEEVTRVH